MSRLVKYLLTLMLFIPMLGCAPRPQPTVAVQDPLITALPPAETVEAAATEIQVETVEAYSLFDELVDPQGAPVSEWNGIPVMPQATTGQSFDSDKYSFKADATSEEAQNFYKTNLAGRGWNESFSIPADANTGAVLGFEKESSILTITFSSIDDSLLVILYLG